MHMEFDQQAPKAKWSQTSLKSACVAGAKMEGNLESRN